MSQPPPQDPHSQPPPRLPVPVYQLDYATPATNKRSGWQVALRIILRIILMIILVSVGLTLLAFGLCLAAFGWQK